MVKQELSSFLKKSRRTVLAATLMALTVAPPFLFSKENDQEYNIGLLKETSRAFTAVSKKAVPAVVYIEATSKSPAAKQGSAESYLDFFHDDFFNRFFGLPQQRSADKPQGAAGSGFLVTEDGYILTNSHLVNGADKVMVNLPGDQRYEAKVIGVDTKTDLAVIKIEGDHFPYLQLGDSGALEVGEWVIAIGNPFGLEASVTVGVVSAKGRSQLNITDFEDFIQTDAAINPGNSGGPLLNIEGNVVGINTAIVSGSGGYMGIGFAVPSNMAKSVMAQLIKSGKVTRGFLGVVLQPIDRELAASFHLDKPQGALVAEVSKGSAAEKAGLKSGDVIVEYNGLPVTNIVQFRNAVSLMDQGKELKLTVSRDAKLMQVNVKIGSEPETKEEISRVSSQLGIEVEALTTDLAKRWGYGGDNGVVIKKVLPATPSDLAGLKPGQLIIAIDRKNITSVEEFDKALDEAVKAKRVLLLVKEGSVTRYIAIKFG